VASQRGRVLAGLCFRARRAASTTTHWEGLGARCFSWSALLLDLLADNEAEGHGIVTETGGEQGDSSL